MIKIIRIHWPGQRLPRIWNYRRLRSKKAVRQLPRLNGICWKNPVGRVVKNNSLALRKPQFKEREAAVQIAAAKEGQARLDLERTRIHSPCNGIILSEDIAIGRILDNGDTGLTIACTDNYQINALFSAGYSIVPESDRVKITTRSEKYEGIIKSVFSHIHPQTRQRQVLVQFKGRQVTIGEYAKLLLPGPFFKKAMLLPEKALRPGKTVWVLDKDNKLDVRTVTILARDMENLVIGSGYHIV